MYMSYCRMEGTLHELRACLGDVDEHVNGYAEQRISDREIGDFRKLVKEFHGWLLDNELIEENGELNEDSLEEICEMMGTQAEPWEDD